MSPSRSRSQPALLAACLVGAGLLVTVAVALRGGRAPDASTADLRHRAAPGPDAREAPATPAELAAAPPRASPDLGAAAPLATKKPVGRTEPPAERAPESEPEPTRSAAGPTRIRGRVATPEGVGVPGVPVWLRSSAASTLDRTETDAAGGFELSAARARGPEELRVRVPRALPEHVVPRCELPLSPAHFAGTLALFEAHPWPPPAAGDVTGRLLSETGAWPDLEELVAGGLVLDLVSLAPADATLLVDEPFPRVDLRPELTPETRADGEVVLHFVFPDVPAGRYELQVSTLGPFRWVPTSREVVPPAAGLELMRYDLDATDEFTFRVLDARTGRPLEAWTAWRIRQTVSAENGVLMHAAPLSWPARIPRDAALDWSLHAPGYAPAFGDATAFRPDGEGGLVAQVELRPGFATRLLVLGRAPVMRPIQGAKVLADGVELGETGPRGLLDVWLPEPPKALEARWKGHRALRRPVPSPESAEARGRGQVLPLVLQGSTTGGGRPR